MAHVSDLDWDRLLGDELVGSDRSTALDHAATCATCAARLAELTAERDAFAPRGGFVPRRARRWYAAGAAAVAAVAAAVVAVLALRDPRGPDELPKGAGPTLVLAAGPAGRLAPLRSGDVVHPRDSLQAAYTASRDGFGAVLSRDGSGQAMAYVPLRGEAMVALAAGTLRSYPESTVLDEVVGEEVVVVLWCAAAHPLAPLVGELERTRAVTAPAGCSAQRVVLDKRAEAR